MERPARGAAPIELDGIRQVPRPQPSRLTEQTSEDGAEGGGRTHNLWFTKRSEERPPVSVELH